MTKQQFLDFLAAADFASLFNEAGWNRPASNRPLRYEIGADDHTLSGAEIEDFHQQFLDFVKANGIALR